MFTLLHILFYPFLFGPVLPDHIAPGIFEYVMKTIKCSHFSTLDKTENAIEIRVLQAFSKLSVFASSVFTLRFCVSKSFHFHKSPFSKVLHFHSGGM